MWRSLRARQRASRYVSPHESITSVPSGRKMRNVPRGADESVEIQIFPTKDGCPSRDGVASEGRSTDGAEHADRTTAMMTPPKGTSRPNFMTPRYALLPCPAWPDMLEVRGERSTQFDG